MLFIWTLLGLNRKLKKLFQKIKDNINILKNEEKFIEYIFNKLFTIKDLKNQALKFYINYFFSMKDFKRLNKIYGKLNEFELNSNDLKEYLMIYAIINENDSKKYKKIINKLKKIISDKRQLHNLYNEIKKQKNEIWKNYYMKSDNFEDKIKLLKIYYKEGNLDKMQEIINNNNDKKLQSREFLLYKLKYYYEMKKYYNFLIEVENLSFNSLSLSDIDIELIKNVINFYIDLNLYNKAKYYLNYLKGYIKEDSFKKIRDYINMNKYSYETKKSGISLLK